jgi:hypothetical protein
MMQKIEMQYIDQMIKNEILNYDIQYYVDTGKLPDNYYNDTMNKRYHYIDEEVDDENETETENLLKKIAFI